MSGAGRDTLYKVSMASRYGFALDNMTVILYRYVSFLSCSMPSKPHKDCTCKDNPELWLSFIGSSFFFETFLTCSFSNEIK